MASRCHPTSTVECETKASTYVRDEGDDESRQLACMCSCCQEACKAGAEDCAASAPAPALKVSREHIIATI
jgi:hypothetical protein